MKEHRVLFHCVICGLYSLELYPPLPYEGSCGVDMQWSPALELWHSSLGHHRPADRLAAEEAPLCLEVSALVVPETE